MTKIVLETLTALIPICILLVNFRIYYFQKRVLRVLKSLDPYFSQSYNELYKKLEFLPFDIDTTLIGSAIYRLERKGLVTISEVRHMKTGGDLIVTITAKGKKKVPPK